MHTNSQIYIYMKSQSQRKCGVVYYLLKSPAATILICYARRCDLNIRDRTDAGSLHNEQLTHVILILCGVYKRVDWFCLLYYVLRKFSHSINCCRYVRSHLAFEFTQSHSHFHKYVNFLLSLPLSLCIFVLQLYVMDLNQNVLSLFFSWIFFSCV